MEQGSVKGDPVLDLLGSAIADVGHVLAHLVTENYSTDYDAAVAARRALQKMIDAVEKLNI